ncbi:thiamine phosphate synthase [Sulfobacillus sp. hq2]|uniref:thiamine phosphate synthase n=1 Tax=Sulfobacillus TaxID=28033 RepID=UPI000CD0B3EE|nr:thiamine phosphate synthase [Sulfobacillus sp. hq2]POB10152.1 thiamine monophosphate synthase [Sulfobacillus sp. hq2]
MLCGLIDVGRFDPAHLRHLPAVGESLDALWLRGPMLTYDEWLTWGTTIRELVPSVPLWIGGHIRAAQALQASGLQWPARYAWIKRGTTKWRGPVVASIHSLSEFEERQEADGYVWGHAFASRSKPGLMPRSRASLEEILKRTAKPVLAIGGINAHTVCDVVSWGVAGVVVGDGIWQQSQPEHAAAAIKQVWTQRKGDIIRW